METHQETLTQVTLQIYLAHLRQWPDTEGDKLIAEAARLATLLCECTGEVTAKAKLRNLELGYDSLRGKYDSAIEMLRHVMQGEE